MQPHKWFLSLSPRDDINKHAELEVDGVQSSVGEPSQKRGETLGQMLAPPCSSCAS